MSDQRDVWSKHMRDKSVDKDLQTQRLEKLESDAVRVFLKSSARSNLIRQAEDFCLINNQSKRLTFESLDRVWPECPLRLMLGVETRKHVTLPKRVDGLLTNKIANQVFCKQFLRVEAYVKAVYQGFKEPALVLFAPYTLEPYVMRRGQFERSDGNTRLLFTLDEDLVIIEAIKATGVMCREF